MERQDMLLPPGEYRAYVFTSQIRQDFLQRNTLRVGLKVDEPDPLKGRELCTHDFILEGYQEVASQKIFAQVLRIKDWKGLADLEGQVLGRSCKVQVELRDNWDRHKIAYVRRLEVVKFLI